MDLAIAGAIASMIGDASMHPIDCIKTLQQSNAGAGLNMISASKQIWKESGIGGFYFGMGTYVTTDGCAGALKFATYEALKVWFDDKIPEENMPYALFGFAAVSFLASSVVLVPGELIKQRLQVGQISSVSSGIRSIWNNEGILGFFAGYSAVCLRDVPYTMLELGIYDNLKSLYLNLKHKRRRPNSESGERQGITQMDEIVAAAITGGIAGYLTSPLDNIKTKLMLQATDAQMYSGFMDCARQMIRANGVASLFQGAAARVAWLVPFTAIYLPVYEIMKRTLQTTNVMDSAGGSSDAALKVKGGSIDGHTPFFREQKQKQKDSARWFHPALGTTAGKRSRVITRTRRNRLDLDECFVSF